MWSDEHAWVDRWMVYFGWDLHVETSGDGAEVFMGMKSAIGHVMHNSTGVVS